MPAVAVNKSRRGPDFILIVIAIFMACAPQKTKDLIGIYEARYSVAEETLTLSADQNYQQMVRMQSPLRTEVATGTWRYDPASGDVIFSEGFILVLDGFRQPVPDSRLRTVGLIVKPVERTIFDLTIGSSEGIIYKRRRGLRQLGKFGAK